jgi:hypothetical protein
VLGAAGRSGTRPSAPGACRWKRFRRSTATWFSRSREQEEVVDVGGLRGPSQSAVGPGPAKLKDPYIFDFLTLAEPFRERELEATLLLHVEKFLLDLGQGFAFVGRQYRIIVGGDEFSIDLLFYHLKLRSFVLIDLKTGAFKAEYAGKMNLYLSAIDDQLRHPTDSPTIGLILCQDRNHVVAEYALRGMTQPIGASVYELTRVMPRELRSSLPSIDEIEAELTGRFMNTRPAKRRRFVERHVVQKRRTLSRQPIGWMYSRAVRYDK